MKQCNSRMLYFMAGTLVVLAGCGKKAQEETTAPSQTGISEEVLISRNGKPLLTVAEFQKTLKDATEADQQMQLMAQFMPDFEMQFFKQSELRKRVLDLWASENKIAEEKEYKEQEDRAKEALRTILNQQMFVKKNVGKVSQEDVAKYYEEHKKDPNFLINPDGVEAKAVTFTSEQAAQDFEQSVRQHKNDLEAAAKNVKKSVDNLGVVSQMSAVDPKVKARVLAVKKFPTIVVVKVNDKDVWVVKATKHVTAKYRPLDERVKKMIEEMLMGSKIEETFAQKIEEFQKQYGLEVNFTYFERKQKEREAERAKMMQEAQSKTAHKAKA